VRGEPRLVHLSPRVLNLADPGHIRHGTARGHVGKDDRLVVRRQNVRAFCHEVHAAKDDELGVGAVCRVACQLERVAGHVGKLNDLIALIVVSQDENALSQGLLGYAGALDESGIGSRGQVARAIDSSLGHGVVTPAE